MQRVICGVQNRAGLAYRWKMTKNVATMLFRILMVALALAANSYGQMSPQWKEPFPPHRVAGNIYYVGSKGLASFLIVTAEGNILINSNLQTSVPQIKENVEKLGFHFGDIKILLISHAHWDHAGGSAMVQQLTGAKYMVMEDDVPVIESGGQADFQYGNSSENLYPPAKVDRILHDGDQVGLGATKLVAHRTAGHTKGCTTWALKVEEKGQNYNVVIVGSPNVNPGYKLVNNAGYPQIARDYQNGFNVLKALPCDIFLGAHGDYYGMEGKFAHISDGGPNPFVDPNGYKSYVDERTQAFRSELAKQSQATQ
ncbi:MAG: subclass B3 metallo-beta-lactamase BJP-1 [Candidatus Acidiferrum sp.]